MEDQREILDRTRRIETRLTSLIKSMGFDSGRLPVFDPELQELHVHSPRVSLQDCLRVIPDGVQVAVLIQGNLLGYVTKGD